MMGVHSYERYIYRASLAHFFAHFDLFFLPTPTPPFRSLKGVEIKIKYGVVK